MAPGTFCMRTTVTSGSCLDATVLTGKVTLKDRCVSQLDGPAKPCLDASALCRGDLERQVRCAGHYALVPSLPHGHAELDAHTLQLWPD